MKIIFANEDLMLECNNQELLIKRYGVHRAKLLRQRLDELFNAEVLADMRTMPHFIIAGSKEDPSQLAVDLGQPYRLVFQPYPHAGMGIGARDWNKIDSIRILEVCNQDVQPNT